MTEPRDRKAERQSSTRLAATWLQAYLLGATASEIANMDAKDSYRRQKFDAIQRYLRGKRVPHFMREPILEFYERLLTQASPPRAVHPLFCLSSPRTQPSLASRGRPRPRRHNHLLFAFVRWMLATRRCWATCRQRSRSSSP